MPGHADEKKHNKNVKNQTNKTKGVRMNSKQTNKQAEIAFFILPDRRHPLKNVKEDFKRLKFLW